MTGAVIQVTTEPLIYELDAERPGIWKALYALNAPIIRNDLLDVLLRAGVDNLQLFPAIVYDRVTGIEHREYQAFNVTGLVSAADMGASTLMHSHSITGIDHDFERLVLDGSRIPSTLLLFRLAESVNAIVVRDSVRKHVEASGIGGMVFYEAGEWAG